MGGAAAASYAVLTFAWLWYASWGLARDRLDDETVLNIAAGVFFAFVLPAVTGCAVGRWWAVVPGVAVRKFMRRTRA